MIEIIFLILSSILGMVFMSIPKMTPTPTPTPSKPVKRVRFNLSHAQTNHITSELMRQKAELSRNNFPGNVPPRNFLGKSFPEKSALVRAPPSGPPQTNRRSPGGTPERRGEARERHDALRDVQAERGRYHGLHGSLGPLPCRVSDR